MVGIISFIVWQRLLFYLQLPPLIDMSDITPNNPPFPAYRASNKESFAHDTVVRRWPIIMDSAITDVKQTIAEEKNDARAQEGLNIVKLIEEIKQELLDDKELR